MFPKKPVINFQILLWMLFFSPQNILAQELRNVKAPVDYPKDNWPMIMLLAVGAALVAIISYRLIKNNRQKNDAEEFTSWEKARYQLDQLEKSSLINQGQFEKYYVKLSEIVRDYLEERFDLRAPEMTTEEFLAHLKSTDVLNDQQKETLKKFLELSDLVKFAQFTPETEEQNKNLQIALKLIDQTIPKEA